MNSDMSNTESLEITLNEILGAGKRKATKSKAKKASKGSKKSKGSKSMKGGAKKSKGST